MIYPRGVAPERMPKADATGLAPKKSAYDTLRYIHRVPEGFVIRNNCSASGAAQLSLSAFLKGFKEKPNFIGEVSERRPWAIKREDRPAVFAGRSKFRL